MNTGLPRHLMVICWPSATGARSISTEAIASTEASGFIWLMNGQAVSAAPTAATEPVAI